MIDISRREPQTLDEYIEEQCRKTGATKEEFLAACRVLPCRCRYSGCTGWISLPK